MSVCRPICDSYICNSAVQTKICTTISGNQEEKPSFSWINNMHNLDNTVTLNIHTGQPLELKLYKRGGVITNMTIDKICKAFTLHNIKAIEIKAQAKSMIELTVTTKKLQEIYL